jgi:hypothetical protein
LQDSKLWGNILSTIFQREIILINDYQTNDKNIANLYTIFKNEYILPINYYELIKDCKYFNFYLLEEERNQYLQQWQLKITNNFIPYTTQEYNFYVKLYLENQYINDIQIEHYIDNGCLCVSCTKARQEIFIKAKKGETNFKKIIHQNAVNKNIITKINTFNSILKNSKQNNRFGIKFS